jgi:sortase (surface protein transpeptidase)
LPTGVDDTSGELTVYPDAGVVGWYEYGPRPGEPGSAVLVNHLDWKRRPGVFYHLASVPVGSIVTIAFSDGSSRSFRVTDSRLVDKAVLALTDVFSRDGPPVLRLITCGGSFDHTTHHYRSNVVVTAVPVD